MHHGGIYGGITVVFIYGVHSIVDVAACDPVFLKGLLGVNGTRPLELRQRPGQFQGHAQGFCVTHQIGGAWYNLRIRFGKRG